MHRMLRTLGALTLVVGLGACKAKTDETRNDHLPTPTVPAQTTRAPMAPAPTPAPTPAPAPAPTAAVASLSDAQIAAIAGAANKSEIDAAKAAVEKTKNPDVRKFADMMITDHTKVDGEANALFTKLDVKPAAGDVSKKIESDAAAMKTKLDAASGTDFDKQYMDGQVAAHQQVLDMLDQQLIPSAHAPELKTLLTSVRASVQAHLAMAKTVQAKL